MASRLNLEVKVGIFAFIALIILTLAVFSISEVYIFRPGYNIKVSFSFASGLNVGAVVRVAGIEAGEIKDIKLDYDQEKGRAKITLLVWLKQGVSVPDDSIAYVNMLGLIGENYLEIIPGRNYEHSLKANEVLIGRDPLSTETLMEVAHKVAEDLEAVLTSINNILDEKTQDDFKATIGNIREFSDAMDQKTALALKETVNNLHQASENIRIITERLERGEGKLGSWLKVKQSSRRKSKAKPEEEKTRPKQNF